MIDLSVSCCMESAEDFVDVVVVVDDESKLNLISKSILLICCKDLLQRWLSLSEVSHL